MRKNIPLEKALGYWLDAVVLLLLLLWFFSRVL